MTDENATQSQPHRRLLQKDADFIDRFIAQQLHLDSSHDAIRGHLAYLNLDPLFITSTIEKHIRQGTLVKETVAKLLAGVTEETAQADLMAQGEEAATAKTLVEKSRMEAAISKLKNTKNYFDTEIAKNPLWTHILSQDTALLDTITNLMNTGLVLMSFQEIMNLYRFTLRTSRLPGDIAEVGTFKGGSAYVMALANQNKRKMHLFDTFDGLPEVTENDAFLEKGTVRGSLGVAKKLLSSFEAVTHFYVGMFPQTASEMPDTTRFSLVNLDMDTYASTKAGLEYFYPRMVRSGMIVSHDYFGIGTPGVKKAIDEFFEGKPEMIVDLWHLQVVIVKM